MTKISSIDSGKSPNVKVNCKGDLIVKGWDQPKVKIAAGPEDLQVEQSETGDIHLESPGDLRLMIPDKSTLAIGEVFGDLAVKNIQGSLSITVAFGDVVIRQLQELEIGQIHGDLSARLVDGPLTAGEISGDTALRNVNTAALKLVHGDFAANYVNGSIELVEVAGDVNLNTINGSVSLIQGHRDASLRNLGGPVSISDVDGDVRLKGGLPSGKHTIKANGDIVLRWPVEAPLNLEASSPGFNIRLPLEDMVENDGFLTGRIGEGETFLKLEAGRQIVLKEGQATGDPWQDGPEADFEFDLSLTGLGEQLVTEIGQRFGDWSARFEEQFGPKISAKIERETQKAAAKAEKAANKAVQKAEKAAKKVRWQESQTHKGSSFTSPPKKAAPTVSTDEQIKVLKMVENGTITPEEANTLLEALGSQ